MPLINLIVPGSASYEDWVLGTAAKGIPIGKFLADVVNFLIVAFALFIFIVKFLGWVLRTRKEETAAPPPLAKDQELLTEIRDLLRGDGQPVKSEDPLVVKGANGSG
jgi:large conductance mechanosensitive channel